ncbi:uncharacterized protein LOC141600913 [Silene latifolia]|uniref:uncharacterized protein LOC141600913 n=1 Tax=Silene latifolia TaxID=37657 RepID=UPI003D776AB4
MVRKSTRSTVAKHSSPNKNRNINTFTPLQLEKETVIGRPNVEEGHKTKSINEIEGIAPFSTEEILVEDVEDSASENESEPEKENLIDDEGEWFQRHGKKIIQMIDEELEELLQLTEEDVQEEITYWKQAVYGFVVGGNPPWQILEGFLKRIWSKYSIDKISFLPNEVFLARFQTAEMQQAVLGSGYFLFDNKPLIIRAWQPDIDLEKEEIKCVPAWIRLKGLPLKFWGQSLPKLANLVGKYVKSDAATESKTRLGFARIMVELKVDQKFPSHITFLDEKQSKIQIPVEYEWKPSTCNKCKQIGHEQSNCRKGLNKEVKKIQKVWRPVQVKKTQPVVPVTIAQDISTPLNKPL